jgi:hypothetical protein
MGTRERVVLGVSVQRTVLAGNMKGEFQGCAQAIAPYKAIVIILTSANALQNQDRKQHPDRKQDKPGAKLETTTKRK